MSVGDKKHSSTERQRKTTLTGYIGRKLPGDFFFQFPDMDVVAMDVVAAR
jgi:hypothetical protein